MATRVLVVDDSGFFRRMITEIINDDPLLDVVGNAVDGRDAIAKAKELKPDVITMDIEMPVMDGITATREIMKQCPTSIIIFSSLSTEGARVTFEALEAGALDYLPKRFEDISSNSEEAKKLLCHRIRMLGIKRRSQPVASATAAVTTRPAIPRHTQTSRKDPFSVLAIGTSTGGPVALQEVLKQIPANIKVPILLVQHMPASFTPSFAQRLDNMCQVKVKQAEDNEALQAGVAYLAPGGCQMLVDGTRSNPRIRIMQASDAQTYKPSVDITFHSLARVFPDRTLAIIMTGMGSDGKEGCKALKKGGSEIWAQDEASCVVYGMPAAIVENNLADQILALNEIGPAINKRVS